MSSNYKFVDGIRDDFLNKQMMVIEVAPGKRYIIEWECASYITSLIKKISHQQWEINNLNSTIRRLKERIQYYNRNDYVLEQLKEREYLF